MKVIVSAQDATPEALVDPRFARAPWLIEMDTDTGEWIAHDNQANNEIAGGAGVQTAGTVVELGVDAVVTGNIGPRAFQTLSGSGIQIFLVGVCSARQAVERLVNGQLSTAKAESIAGHWL